MKHRQKGIWFWWNCQMVGRGAGAQWSLLNSHLFIFSPKKLQILVLWNMHLCAGRKHLDSFVQLVVWKSDSNFPDVTVGPKPMILNLSPSRGPILPIYHIACCFDCPEGLLEPMKGGCIIFRLWLVCGWVFSRLFLFNCIYLVASGVGMVGHFLTHCADKHFRKGKTECPNYTCSILQIWAARALTLLMWSCCYIQAVWKIHVFITSRNSKFSLIPETRDFRIQYKSSPTSQKQTGSRGVMSHEASGACFSAFLS